MIESLANTPLTVDGMLDYLRSAPPEQKERIRRAVEVYTGVGWLPQPGPQYEAYHSPADELLYGGAAGGGKTDLLIGLSLTAHKRSVLFRRQATDLKGLWERLVNVAGNKVAKSNSVDKVLITSDNRLVEGGHLEKPGSEKSWQGRPHDLIGLDEGAQLDEYKVIFVTQWLRSVEGHRCRLVVATNPPIPEYKDGKMVDNGTGDWLLRWWAPWLDARFPIQAEPGELMWCFMRADGERYETVWVEGPGHYNPETGERVENPSEADIMAGRVVSAKSRTFIRSLLKDNSYLKDTGYAERLAATPEPLRSLLLSGTFGLRLEDNAMQVIPTQWVVMANDRWEEHKHKRGRLRQLVLFTDVAQGGVDSTVHAALYDENFFDDLGVRPGRDTPDGPSVVAGILARHRDRALIALDGTGGWAGDAQRVLSDRHKIEAEMLVASRGSGASTADGRWQFGNLRAQAWWQFREALDPHSLEDIKLPPNGRLLAQLTAPVWYIRNNRLFIESKEEIMKRLPGTSTDEADAVIGAWFYRREAQIRVAQEPLNIVEAYNQKRFADGTPIEEPYDPLKEW